MSARLGVLPSGEVRALVDAVVSASGASVTSVALAGDFAPWPVPEPVDGDDPLTHRGDFFLHAPPSRLARVELDVDGVPRALRLHEDPSGVRLTLGRHPAASVPRSDRRARRRLARTVASGLRAGREAPRPSASNESVLVATLGLEALPAVTRDLLLRRLDPRHSLPVLLLDDPLRNRAEEGDVEGVAFLLTLLRDLASGTPEEWVLRRAEAGRRP